MMARLPTVEGEKPEREMSYCSSPLFFCFSVLSFYFLVSSSLPLSVCVYLVFKTIYVHLSNNPLLPSLYSVLFFKFVSQKFCPLWFPFFSFSSPFPQFASFFSPKNLSSFAPLFCFLFVYVVFVPFLLPFLS